jgi:tRNA(Ile)-lysidine synthase TilS/MesJ
VNGLNLEPLLGENFSVYLMGNEHVSVDVKKLVDYFVHIPVKFVTVDLGFNELRKFERTELAKILKEHNIPYFSTELPLNIKRYFSEEVVEIQDKLDELRETYDGLNNKNSASAQELKTLIDKYLHELESLDREINLKKRTDAIVRKITNVVKDHDDPETIIVHFGEEKTFIEILKQLKDHKVKANIIFVQLARFL